MSQRRPRDLNPANPQYTWELDDGKLTIYAECCADTFSDHELEILHEALTEHFADQEASDA